MAELINFPIVNQLNSPTLDQRPDENKWFNCVICSLLACLLYYRPELKGKLEPDSIKDAVLGENYRNEGTDAVDFVKFFSQFGVKLYPVAGKNLYQLAHQLIQAGLPAVFTEVDPYVDTSKDQYKGWTHVCVWFKEAQGTLTAMDPFGVKIIAKPDGQWPVVGNQLWTMEKNRDSVPVKEWVPTNWKDDGTTLIAPNGHKVVKGFRTWVLSHDWDANNLPLEEEHAQSPLELSNPHLGDGTQQVFRWATLEWTQSRGVFMAWSGLELLKYRQLLGQINQLSKI